MRRIEKEHENSALLKVLDTQREAARSMEEGRREIWRLNHDIGHRMAAIRFLFCNGESESGMKELNLLYEELNGNVQAVMEGEDFCNYLINSKLERASSRGIAVRKRIAPGAYTDISPIDFSIILGNLLDNAIEAQLNNETGQEAENGWIDFFMEEGIGFIFIEIRNTCREGPPEKDGSFFLSRKREQHKHGAECCSDEGDLSESGKREPERRDQ